MLTDEIENAKRLVRTDAYQMSIGEIVSLYDDGEIIIDPEFQRLFRWGNSQKSRLIESILLGIPLPPIFVFEKEDAKWELVDGLQRLSTLLEFMGKLRTPEGMKERPSILESTKYLPSLHNCVWEKSEKIEDVDVDNQIEVGKINQLAIRRARIGVEILKRPSDEQTKFDLFQRLNAGGTIANAQELRNCVMLMVNKEYFRMVKSLAETESFRQITGFTDDQKDRQKHMEFATRFLIHCFTSYDGKLDVEEYIDDGTVKLCRLNNIPDARSVFIRTFDLLFAAVGENALRRFEGGRYVQKVGLVGLEGIAVGVAKNIDNILNLADPKSYVRDRSQAFWAQQESAGFTSPGLRGTVRLTRTVPFGEKWFCP
ncbi:DUF262 domain-containing protein [Methylobacterium sp. NFXW15]|uniref:DUF262 domain-containing protein n=1 Tax=Methylobacterium sp. NFXW15 TaxID=2819512 RepID=UPI003CEF7D1F